MSSLFVKILKGIFGEIKHPEKYDKITTFVANGEKYEMKGWQEKNIYFVYCERLEKIIVEENEEKAFDKMSKYIIDKVIWKKENNGS